MCCMDISAAGDGWNTSNANWQKKCCMPSNGYPVIPPPSDVSDEKIPAINTQITNMGPGLTEVKLLFTTHSCFFKYLYLAFHDSIRLLIQILLYQEIVCN